MRNETSYLLGRFYLLCSWYAKTDLTTMISLISLKLAEWQPRSRRGQFLGFSDQYSCKVGLNFNRTKDSFTPQFNEIYNGLFSSVPYKVMKHFKQTVGRKKNLKIKSRFLLLLPNGSLHNKT